MATSTPNKTVGTTLFTAATVASAVMVQGPDIDVSTKISGTALVRLGRTVTTLLSNYVGFKIEGSAKASGDDWWVPMYTWTNTINAVTGIIPASNLLLGATSAGATTYTLDSATGQNAGDLVFFYEAGAYEWARTASVSGAVATPLDPLVYAHADDTIVLDQGEEFFITLDFSNVKRVRLIVDTASAGGSGVAAVGQTVFVEAFLNTLDSVTIV